jgi:hypothetical protein
MHLLEFPLEIFHMILAHTIVQGYAENFTQLQLVNSKFLSHGHRSQTILTIC